MPGETGTWVGEQAGEPRKLQVPGQGTGQGWEAVGRLWVPGKAGKRSRARSERLRVSRGLARELGAARRLQVPGRTRGQLGKKAGMARKDRRSVRW